MPFNFHRLYSWIMKCIRVVFLTVACYFSCFAASSQYDSLLNKTYAERAPYLWRIGDAVYFQHDSAVAFTIADSLIEFGRKNKARMGW